MNLKLIIFNINGFYRIWNKEDIKNKLSNNIQLNNLYNTYVSEFRSEDEALYCLTHIDDYTNHLCPTCKNICEFYCNKRRRQEYRKACKNKICRKNLRDKEKILAKMIKTCRLRYGFDYVSQVKAFQIKAEDTKERLYGNRHYNNPEKRKNTNMKIRNVPYPMMNPKVVETWLKNYFEKHNVVNPLLLEETQSFLNQIKEGLTLAEMYSNKEYFKEFIKLLYTSKERLLKIDELCNIINLDSTTINKRVHELKLEEYFDLHESKLETQFRDFLITNHYNEKDNFKRRNKILRTNSNIINEIDFLVNNVGFEINDLCSHNISKDYESTYHINKTLMAEEQHNIRLIHLWEWELNETNWPKISQWILHILNQNKIQLTLEDCNYDIRYVSKEDEQNFLNIYSITSYQDSDTCLGIYCKDNLIQILSFKGDTLSICVKFGYHIIDGTKELIETYLFNNQINYILTYCNLDKFTGQTYENIGFKLINYQDPFIISEVNTTTKSKQVYNCGYKVYIMFNEFN